MGANLGSVARPPSPEVVVPPPGELPAVAVRPLSALTLLCAVSGEVDPSTAPHVRERILGLISSAGPDLVIDLSEVGLLAAAGLAVLVEARAAARAFEVGLCVVARTRPVLRSLTVTGLGGEFEVFPHVDDVPIRGLRSGVLAGRDRSPAPAPGPVTDVPRSDLP